MALFQGRNFYLSKEVHRYFGNNPGHPDAKCLFNAFQEIASGNFKLNPYYQTGLLCHIDCNHIIVVSATRSGDILIVDLLPPHAQPC